MRWFRFYSEALDDPKVQLLPPELFKVWVNLLCLANQSKERGQLPPLEECAFRLRLSDDDMRSAIAALAERGLLDFDGDGTSAGPHNWNGRQADSDNVAERVRRHRAQRSGNDASNVTETPLDADTDSETEPEITAPVADVPEVDLTDGEREVVRHIRAVRGLASVSEVEIALHLREVLSARDGPPLSRAALRLDAIRFRDHWQAKRANAPPHVKWRGWKNAVTKWFSQTYELKANGKAPETIPDRDEHAAKHLKGKYAHVFDNAERIAS